MARQLRKSAVVNANKLSLDLANETVTCTLCPSKIAKRGDVITIDGSTGYIYFGDLPKVSVGQDEHFRTVMQWADKYKRMEVQLGRSTMCSWRFAWVPRGLGSAPQSTCPTATTAWTSFVA